MTRQRIRLLVLITCPEVSKPERINNLSGLVFVTLDKILFSILCANSYYIISEQRSHGM